MSRSPHHANLLLGTLEEAESYLHLFCDTLGIELANNPDYFPFRMDVFGIDEARELRLLSSRKALGNEKIFFITPTRLTLEAQNALLKTFEDPTPNTYFFLVVREEGLIVPTLRSRMQIERLHGGVASVDLSAEKFLSLSVRERILFAHKFADEEKSLPIFLDDLLLLLRKELGREQLVAKVYKIRRMIHDSSISSRLVIEHLVLVLP